MVRVNSYATILQCKSAAGPRGVHASKRQFGRQVLIASVPATSTSVTPGQFGIIFRRRSRLRGFVILPSDGSGGALIRIGVRCPAACGPVHRPIVPAPLMQRNRTLPRHTKAHQGTPRHTKAQSWHTQSELVTYVRMPLPEVFSD